MIPILATPVDNSVGTVDNFAHRSIVYATAYAMQLKLVHPSFTQEKLQFFLHFLNDESFCTRPVEGFIF